MWVSVSHYLPKEAFEGPLSVMTAIAIVENRPLKPYPNYSRFCANSRLLQSMYSMVAAVPSCIRIPPEPA